jgi:hypothetical protein
VVPGWLPGTAHLSVSEKKQKVAFFSRSGVSNPRSLDRGQRNEPVGLAIRCCLLWDATILEPDWSEPASGEHRSSHADEAAYETRNVLRQSWFCMETMMERRMPAGISPGWCWVSRTDGHERHGRGRRKRRPRGAAHKHASGRETELGACRSNC